MLAQVYDLRGTLTPLDAEYDVNLRVDSERGAFLLKILRAGSEAGFAEMQIAALEHLQQRAPDLLVQRVQRTNQGALHTTLRDDSDNDRVCWVTTYLPGRLLADVRPHDAAVRRELGTLLGRADRALRDFSHPWLARELEWDLRRAGWIAPHLDAIVREDQRALVRTLIERYRREWQPQLATARSSAIHGDANDHNLLLCGTPAEPKLALLDFGDLHRSALVGELAIAATYAMMTADAPLAALAELTAAYHRELPLLDEELALVLPLVLTRLCVSVTVSARRRVLRPGDPYGTVHEDAAWRLLTRLAAADLRAVEAKLRAACRLEVWPLGAQVAHHLATATTAPVLGSALAAAKRHVLDLSFASLLGGDDPETLDTDECGVRIARALRIAGASLGIGRYGEPRPIYPGPAFGSDRANGSRRTRHLGIDLFAPAGTTVHAPIAGEVVHVADCQDRLDYGGLVVLRHRLPSGAFFGSLYGHLDPDSIARLQRGQLVAAGEAMATLGAPPRNGDWPPHLHCQLLALDPATGPEAPPGVADPDDFAAASAIYPNPAPLLGLDESAAWSAAPLADLLAERRAHFASNLKLSYRTPLDVARGIRHFLYDREGRRYLDAYNNVPHVGHSHPRVVAAVQQQFALLATNTRYVYEGLTHYSRRLLAHCPPELSVCFLVPSGSEANELALRLCRAHTGRRDVMVMEHGYHGHTTGTMDVSPYKYRQPHGGGAPSWVHESVQPDVYRGLIRSADAGPQYAALVAAQIAQLAQRGVSLAGYLCECLPSVGGQLVLPDGFLPAVYRAIRAHGGVCIADDVQTALGRTGSHFFGFQLADAIPDILVLGKPLGGGYPLGAVVTTKAIAESFARMPEFFSTFGGNNVACAAGIAVLDALEHDRLQQNALRTGEHVLRGLRELQRTHAVIGDVRGRGLFLGVDLVTDRETRTPATAQASYLKNRLRERRILIGTDGPHDNVLKIRPPMTFDRAAADTLLEELADLLREDGAKA